MKLLLTSAGIKNTSIHDALVDLLGKPIAESDALCIPTASYAHPMAGPGRAWSFISGQEPRCPMTELGWKSIGVLELTALPSLDQETLGAMVRETDVLLVNGGDALYLCYWMRQSGLADLLPSLHETAWVGLSAGSMVMTPRIGEDFVQWKPASGGDETLGLVDFSIYPHLAPEGVPGNTMADAERWAAEIDGPAYAIDDDTAIQVVDGTVDVVSEGDWRLSPQIRWQAERLEAERRRSAARARCRASAGGVTRLRSAIHGRCASAHRGHGAQTMRNRLRTCGASEPLGPRTQFARPCVAAESPAPRTESATISIEEITTEGAADRSAFRPSSAGIPGPTKIASSV